MPLAVLAAGRFTSAYAGKPAPSMAPSPDGAPVAPSSETPIAESPETQIVVVGNSQFITNQFLRIFPANLLFAQNALDFVSSGDDLIAIRSRGATDRPIKQLSEGAKAAVKYMNTLGIAALVVVFGLIRRVARRNQRERLAANFRPAGRGPSVEPHPAEEGAIR
ncbi:MAG: hypothetical protein U0527_06950 [Candidatus Eisenbacteria bacterium]